MDLRPPWLPQGPLQGPLGQRGGLRPKRRGPHGLRGPRDSHGLHGHLGPRGCGDGRSPCGPYGYVCLCGDGPRRCCPRYGPPLRGDGPCGRGGVRGRHGLLGRAGRLEHLGRLGRCGLLVRQGPIGKNRACYLPIRWHPRGHRGRDVGDQLRPVEPRVQRWGVHLGHSDPRVPRPRGQLGPVGQGGRLGAKQVLGPYHLRRPGLVGVGRVGIRGRLRLWRLL